jgi:aspartate carbamoyltransferase catalytic subunit
MTIAPKPSFVLSRRHLLGIEGLSHEDITGLLDLSEEFVELNRQVEKKRTSLRGRTQINLFFEVSTRTQASFELAGKRLGADVMNMSTSSSSMRKGETLIDTAITLNAMHPDIIVVRHHASGAVELLARKVATRAISTAFWLRSVAISCIRASRVRTSSCSTPWARGCVLLPPPHSCRPA